MTPTSIAGRIGSRTGAAVAVVCLALGLGIGATPAASATSVASPVAAQSRGAAAPATAKSCGHTRYGYHGILKCGDPKHGHIAMVDVTWRNGQKETFGIAPNRAIYHVWPGSGGWKVMPGNGRADWMGDHYERPGRPDYRTVDVRVNGYDGFWANTLARIGSTGSWSGWVYSPGAAVRPAHP